MNDGWRGSLTKHGSEAFFVSISYFWDFDIKVTKEQDDRDINMTSFWKDIINALRRTNTEN